MEIAIDSEYDEVTKIPFIVTMSDGVTSKLFYPDKLEDYYIIKKICKSKKIEKVFHSATADMYALYQIGIKVFKPYHCTFVQSNLIDENFASRKLKDLAKKYLNEPCKEQQELNKIKAKYKRKYKKDFRWTMIPKEVIEPYAVKDVEYTIALHNYFRSKLKPYKKLYKLELSIIPMILDMEIRGHRIDREFCKQELSKLYVNHDYYYNKLIKFYGRIFNLQSPKDIRSLFKKAEVNIKERTSTGLMSTSKEIIEPLAKENKIIKWSLLCRNASKQIGTYYEPLLNNYTYPNDDNAHFSFYQSGAKSGRFSAELIQTIPKEKPKHEIANNVRRAFIPRKGYVNLYFDYDQIEMKLFAHFTNNKSLIEAIKKGFDPHDQTAMDMFGDKYKEDPEGCRRDAKDVNFGIIYGMGARALSVKLGKSLQETYVILSKYDQKYRVRSFISQMTSLLHRQGYIELEWIDREYRVPKDLAYKCVNILIQGSAAYVIKLAMKRLKGYIAEIIGLNLLIQMHDELIFECHQSLNVKQISYDIKNLMEDHTTFKVPITVSSEYSVKSWADKVKWKHGK